MRTLFVFLVGVAVGAVALHYYQQWPADRAAGSGEVGARTRASAEAAVAHGRAGATAMSEMFTRKMQQWHLTPDDIRADLAKTGEVARQNTTQLRERVADVRIIAEIKAKYVLDRDLSATAIQVESRDGDVTLAGSVTAESLIGKAVALALDTEGVHHVTAKLQVKLNPP